MWWALKHRTSKAYEHSMRKMLQMGNLSVPLVLANGALADDGHRDGAAAQLEDVAGLCYNIM